MHSYSNALRQVFLALMIAGIAAPALSSQTTQGAQLTVDAGTIVSPVSPTLYGLMTEEINHSYEGGLYGELIQNRAFHHVWSGEDGWSIVRRGNARAEAKLDRTSGPSQALPFSYRLAVASASPGNEAGISNSGWWGMAVRPDSLYQGSLWAQLGNNDPGPLTLQLVGDDTGAVLASATVTVRSGPWAQYTYTLHTGKLSAVTSRNHLELTVAQPGSISFQLISLFPPTYANRPGGFRPDLMERLAAMHPHFLRLPGGNYLEGDRIEDHFDWKKTIGPMVDRPGHQAPWSYWSSDGLGLLEFLEWCEDLHMEPLLAVYAGYSLKGEHIIPGPDLQPTVQDALDEVEYVTGDVSTKWGAERARDGHPAPFPLHYIEIGNEDEFDKSHTYPARFAQIATALHTKYPQYKLIATTPVTETDPKAQPDLIDDHYYKPPAEMLAFTHRYDNAPRNGPKIFVGEWATRSGSPTPNFGDALGDAAFMTSMERNSDLILMASYAPLLVNVSPGAMQWATDLIGFDALTTYASPSYYAQALFASHLGEGTVKTSLSGGGDLFFHSATVSQGTHTLHLKLVNASTVDQPLNLTLNGLGSGAHAASVQSLHGATFLATNSLNGPDARSDAIHPVSSTVRLRAGTQSYTVPALTIQVLDIPMQ